MNKKYKKIKIALKQSQSLYGKLILICGRMVLDYQKRYIILPKHLACLSLSWHVDNDEFPGSQNLSGNILKHSCDALERAMRIPEPNLSNFDIERDVYQEIMDNFFVYLDKFIYLKKEKFIPKSYLDDEIDYWIEVIINPCHVTDITGNEHRRFMLLPYLIIYYNGSLLLKKVTNKVKEISGRNSALKYTIGNTESAEVNQVLNGLLE